jgi:hypothetical protein
MLLLLVSILLLLPVSDEQSIIPNRFSVSFSLCLQESGSTGGKFNITKNTLRMFVNEYQRAMDGTSALQKEAFAAGGGAESI